MEIPGIRTFEQFPEDSKCPVCGTNEQGLTVLVPIYGTQRGNNAEAICVHLKCAVIREWRNDMQLGLVMGIEPCQPSGPR
jgi:hypothetical protein